MAAGGSEVPAVIAHGLEWCRAERPVPEPPPSLLWGDVRIGNVVFDDGLRPAAVLDWEMATVGPAEVDLGWFLALHRLTVESAGADLPGFPDRDATVAAYQDRLGRPVADLGWFETFALVRSGAIMVRVARLLRNAGIGDSWLRDNPVVDRLARRLR